MTQQGLLNLVLATLPDNIVQAIEPVDMRSILNNIVNTVFGLYIQTQTSFKGLATPTTDPGTPAGNEFWLAIAPGTYTNFGGSEVDTSSLAVMAWDGTEWTISQTAIPQPENKIEDWSAGSYSTGAQVNHDGQLWEANADATASDIPGTSDKWDAVTEVKDGSISPIKTDFFEVGVNLFDKTDITDQRYVDNTTGELAFGSTYSAGNYIPVDENTDYTIIGAVFLAWYDSSKTYISGAHANVGDTTLTTVTSPANASFIRFGIHTTLLDTTMFVKGDTYPSVYYPYTFVLKKENLQKVETSDIEDGSITTTKIADSSVTPDKTNFFSAGANLFNPDDPGVELGKYINETNGNTSGNATYNSTGFMPVVGGHDYTVNYKHSLAWYNSSKVFISGSPSSDPTKTLTAPDNAAFIRCTVNAALNWSSYMINEGDAALPYVPFEYVWAIPVQGQQTNNIIFETAFPAKRYLLKDNENSLYFENVCNKWIQDSQYLRVSGQGFITYDKFARVVNPTTEGNFTIDEYDGNFVKSLSKTVAIKLGDPATDNGAITFNAIGDSYTNNGAWVSILRQKLPNIAFLGIRIPYGDSNINVEGRSGWTLNAYFANLHLLTDSFTPFMHPNGYKYYGNTDFWKKATIASPAANYDGFQDIISSVGGFTSGGFRTTPSENDLMYDDENSVYKKWDGAAWTATAITDADFVFNYGQYRATWGIAAPTYVAVMLAVNDFVSKTSQADVDTAFADYKTKLETVLTSVKADTPTVRFISMLPVISLGIMDNIGGAFTKMQQYIMYEVRKKMIAAFDGREDESLYLVDSGSCVDPEYGFVTVFNTPFDGYTGSETRKMISNSPHPSTQGYYQLGIAVAAFIQNTR